MRLNNVKPFTTYAAFQYMTVLGIDIFGGIILQVQGGDGVRFALLPLAKGDPSDNLENAGLVFLEGMDFSRLDNRLVSFKIASAPHPNNFVISFTGNGIIATISLANGQLGWLGATGYCTFFTAPASPSNKPTTG